MDRRNPARGVRVMTLSALSGMLAPLVFVALIVAHKVAVRVHVKTRFWNKRLQHELARWT
jgi:hypothetical protein